MILNYRYFVIFLFFGSSICDECDEIRKRIIENRNTCPNNDVGKFPIKGSCTEFIACTKYQGLSKAKTSPPAECGLGEIFNGTFCIERDTTNSDMNCPQRRCFPQETQSVDKTNLEYESTSTTRKSTTMKSSVSESKPRGSGHSSGASSSLISFCKIIISISLIEFTFVILYIK